MDLSGQAGTDAVAEGFAVHGFAFEQGLGCFHDGAHLLDGIGSGIGNGFGDGGVHFGVGGAGGKVGFDDGELFGLFVGDCPS